VTSTDFGYTGQRKLDSGMGGIMDYKARFYSPTLGRFTQPDSIIPGAANPQNWNRFSYVYNNPVLYNDPTGHLAGCDVDYLGSCRNMAASLSYVSLSTQSNPNRPDKIDPDAPAEVTDLYNLYGLMWKDKGGWWWEQYGSGGFTIWEFMAVMWGYEQQGFPNTKNYAAALSSRGAWWCGNRCDVRTVEGSMQFMMGFAQVIPDRVACLASGECTWEEALHGPLNYWVQDRRLIVNGIRHGNFSGNPHALFDVGNMSLRPDIFKKMANRGMIHTIWGQPGEDLMIILEYCQWQVMDYALKNGGAKAINMRLYNNYCGGQ
jgi:RHS repeat-associated protein